MNRLSLQIAVPRQPGLGRTPVAIKQKDASPPPLGLATARPVRRVLREFAVSLELPPKALGPLRVGFVSAFPSLRTQPLCSRVVAGGWTNRNLLISCGSDEALLRLPGQSTEIYLNRENEARNAAILADQDLTPGTFAVDIITGVQLRRYAKGTVLSDCGPLDDTLLARVAHTVRRLHTGTRPLAGDLDHGVLINAYRQIITDRGHAFAPAYADLFVTTTRILDTLRRAGAPTVPCHNDLHVGNMLVTERGEIVLLDLEFAANADPAWDLAYFMKQEHFTRAQVDTFLRAYCDGEPSVQLRARVTLWRVVVEVYCALWARLQLALGNPMLTAESLRDLETAGLTLAEERLRLPGFAAAQAELA